MPTGAASVSRCGFPTGTNGCRFTCFVPNGRIRRPIRRWSTSRRADARRLQSSRRALDADHGVHLRSGRTVVVSRVSADLRTAHVRRSRGQDFLRQISIQRGQDVRRTVDYLETRPDIDRSRIAFYGFSLGAQLAPVYLAIEPRFRTGVLLSGGFETWTIPPETDPVNFRAPRQTACADGQRPRGLRPAVRNGAGADVQDAGDAEADKRHVVFEGGHLPPRPQEVFKEILDWLDRYMGPVAR